MTASSSIAASVVLLLVAVGCASDPTSPGTTAGSEPGSLHVVLDTDLAFDDIMALLYLLRRDDVVLDAVTLAGTGEAHCDPGVRNALALLALGGSPNTPVACGRESPLEGTNVFPDEWRAAVDDLSMLDLPAVAGDPDPRGVVQILLDEVRGGTVLISLGPLTNVADALRADPSFAERARSFVAMAGQVEARGNAPNGLAEYNVWVDPTAANEVLTGLDVMLVPLDATDQVPFTAYFAEALADAPSTPESEAVGAIVEANRDFYLSGGAYFWDPLAAVLALEPGMATWREEPLVVATRLPATQGQLYTSDEGVATRFASAIPDPLAFEREYLTTLTASDVTTVRPDPTMAIRFDGERCGVEPASISAGPHDVAFASSAPGDAVAVVLRTNVGLSYAELRALLGAQGSRLPSDDPALGRIEQIAEVRTMTPVDIEAGTIAVVCAVFDERGAAPRVWLGDELTVRGS